MTSRGHRRLAVLLLALAVILLAVRVALLQGLVTRVQIDGGSMAEALPGEHIELRCLDCSRLWRVDAAQLESAYLACPDCGLAVDDETPSERRPAARVVIDRGAYLLDRPQRFDVVAFRSPGTADLAVKRIVALPGEEWQIRQGELWTNGQMVRKSYSQFRETSTVVSSLGRHWRPEENSRWQSDADDWIRSEVSDTPHWLVYHHTAAHPAARGKPSPVQDFDPYNPAMPRELHEMLDVVARCHVTAADVVLHCRVHDGTGELVLRWDLAAGQVTALRGEREFARARTLSGPLSAAQIAWGLCDGRLWLALNSNIVLQHELDAAAKPAEGPTSPLALGVSGEGECRVDELEVLRDIYYLDAHGRNDDWQLTLGASEYGVLGDNPPLSVDSRQWDHGIGRQDIRGKVWRR